MNIIERIKENPKLKSFIIRLLSSKHHPRPRFWVRLFINPFIHTRKRGSMVRSLRARMDLFPWKNFYLGYRSIIEDNVTVNNGAGDVFIGDDTIIGIGSVIIGPVNIGNRVGIGQNVFVAGFNHKYNPAKDIPKEEDVDKRGVVIGDDCHIGANVSIVAGVELGRCVIVGAGSVVTKSFPSYSLVAGNPAKIVKKFDFDKKEWIRV